MTGYDDYIYTGPLLLVVLGAAVAMYVWISTPSRTRTPKHVHIALTLFIILGVTFVSVYATESRNYLSSLSKQEDVSPSREAALIDELKIMVEELRDGQNG